MFRPQMASLAPRAPQLGTASISNWELFINEHGVLSIREAADSIVYGMLWSCTPDDLVSLDHFEAVADGLYTRDLVEVRPSGSEPVDAYVYRSVSTTSGTPRPGYLEQVVLPAMHELGFPPDYLTTAQRLLDGGTAGDRWPTVPETGSTFNS